MDLLSVALEAAYLAIFGASVIRFIRRPNRLNRAVLLAFSAYGAVFAVAAIIAVVPALRPISPLAAVALLAQPYATVRLLRQFSPVSPTLERGALAAFIASAAAVVLFGTSHTISVTFIVVCFVGVEALAAHRFWVASRVRIGVPRTRLALAAGATAIFAMAIVVAFGASALAPGQPYPAAALIATRLAILLAGLGYLAALAPPARLRSFLSRASAFELTRELVSSPAAPDTTELWDRLAATVGKVLGTDSVAIEDGGTGRLLAATPAYAHGTATGSLVSSTPVLARDTDTRALRNVRLRLPSTTGDGPIVVAVIRDTALFEEDDLTLVELLGSITEHAVERERALLELADARSSLAEASAREASDIRFQALLDAEPSGVLVADEDGRITYANAAAAETFGYTVAQMVTHRVEDLVPPNLRNHHPAHRAEFVARPETRPMGRGRELSAVRADGSTFPIEVALSPFRSGGQLLTIGVVSDISARRAAEEVRDRFLDMLSHELRTPVTSIYGGAQVLLARSDHLDGTTRREILYDIADEAERLERMVENLLVLARVERGSDLRRSEPVLLGRLVPSLVERERRLWPDTTFRLSVPSGLPIVAGDEEYLSQILRNLLSNAAKYGGSAEPIEINIGAADGGVEVRIADRGPGFPAADAERLFQLYVRLAATAAVAPGAGVGLFVSRKLAAALGADITARPRQGGGAEFVLHLALYDTEDIDEPAESPIPTRVDRADPVRSGALIGS